MSKNRNKSIPYCSLSSNSLHTVLYVYINLLKNLKSTNNCVVVSAVYLYYLSVSTGNTFISNFVPPCSRYFPDSWVQNSKTWAETYLSDKPIYVHTTYLIQFQFNSIKFIKIHASNIHASVVNISVVTHLWTDNN